MKSLPGFLGCALTATLVGCGGNPEPGNAAGDSGNMKAAKTAEQVVRTATLRR